MKKAMLFFTVLAVLTIGFWGCNGGDTPWGQVDPPANLTVVSGQDNISQGDAIEIEIETTRNFTANAQGATGYAWTVVSGDQLVTLTNYNTATVTIAANALIGRAQIKVTARNSSGEVTMEFYVDVTSDNVLWVAGVTEGSTVFIPNDLTTGREFTAHTTLPGNVTFQWTAVTAGVVTLSGENTNTVTIVPATDGSTVITVTAETETFSFTVLVGEPFAVGFAVPSLRGQANDWRVLDVSQPAPTSWPWAHWPNWQTPSPENAQLTQDLRFVPSVGSSAIFRGSLTDGAISGITYLWESSHPSIASIHQITTPGVVNDQHSFAIVTATGVGTATITFTATAPNGRQGSGSFTFTVGNETFNHITHPYASRLIINFQPRDRRNNPDNESGANAGSLGRLGMVTGLQNQQYWSVRPNLQVGRRMYPDREDRTFAAIPPVFIGSDWIMTPAHRGTATDGGQPAGTNRSDLVTFRALEDIDIFIVYDSRAFHGSPQLTESGGADHAERPVLDWLIGAGDSGETPWVLQGNPAGSMYVLTGESIGANEPSNPASAHSGIMRVRKRSFTAGTVITLGGWRSSTINMYTIIIRPTPRD